MLSACQVKPGRTVIPRYGTSGIGSNTSRRWFLFISLMVTLALGIWFSESAEATPQAISLELAQPISARTETLTLYATGSDAEDAEYELRPEFQYLPPGLDDTPLWIRSTGGLVQSLDISADGRYVAVGGEDQKVYLFHLGNGSLVWSHGTGGIVRSVAISGDGSHIAAGSDDDRVYLFSSHSPTPLWNYTAGHDVRSVAISNDGSHIAAGSLDHRVYLFERPSSTPLWDQNIGGDVRSVAISADGDHIVAGSQDRRVYLFHRTNDSSPSWSYPTGDEVVTVDISSDGNYITAGSLDRKVYLFHRGDSTPSWSFEAGGEIRSVSISAQGEHLAAGSTDDSAYIFSRANATPLRNYTTGDNVEQVRLSADGRYLFASSDKAYLFDRENGSAQRSYISNSRAIALASSGELMVAGDQDSDIHSFRTWRSEDFQDNSYVDGRWESAFIPQAEHELGLYSFRCRFNDTSGAHSDWLYLSEALELVNREPEAAIDPLHPAQVNEGALVDLIGHGLDHDGTVINYTWNSSLDGPLGSQAELHTGNLSVGNHTITFSVQDNEGLWSLSANIELVVNGFPIAILSAIEPSPALESLSIHFQANGTDDGSLVRFQWRSDLDGVFYNSTARGFDYLGLSNGTHTIFLRVQDEHGAWSEEQNAQLLVQGDRDNDGVMDTADRFADDPAASKDSDGDGAPDEWNPGHSKDDSTTGLYLDDLPTDPAASKDSDGDGHPDLWNPGMSRRDSTSGLERLDNFPTDPAASLVTEGFGSRSLCNPGSTGADSTEHLVLDLFPTDEKEWTDTDGDGFGNNFDNYPTDIAASLDTDSDGYPDEWNPGRTEADSTEHLVLDLFPNDPAASKDRDGDGHPDQWNPGLSRADSNTGLRLDVFPKDPDEWRDSDGDGIGDRGDFAPSIHNHYLIASLIVILVVGAFLPLHFGSRRAIAASHRFLMEQKELGVQIEDAGQSLKRARQAQRQFNYPAALALARKARKQVGNVIPEEEGSKWPVAGDKDRGSTRPKPDPGYKPQSKGSGSESKVTEEEDDECGSLRVMIVDNDDLLVEQLRDNLTRQGHEVNVASTAKIALSLLEREPLAPQAILLEVHLGAKEGLDLISRLKKLWPETHIIAMIGSGSGEFADKATRSGADETITKPFRASVLAAKLRTIDREPATPEAQWQKETKTTPKESGPS